VALIDQKVKTWYNASTLLFVLLFHKECFKVMFQDRLN
jgi:hypothetical protein